MFEFRDRKMAKKIVENLKALDVDITLMHVCGGHQDTFIRYGIDDLFRDVGVDIRQGPGCPVCVTPADEIEEIMLLAEKGKTVAVFGDMMRVPGEESTLFDMRTRGADVAMVYSIDDGIAIARKNPGKEVVFMAIGFETTAPSTAAVILRDDLPSNFSILNTHRLVPPALKCIVEMGEIRLNGLIEPGHVSAIIGVEPYEFLTKEYGMPQVVAGFEPLDLMMAVYRLAVMSRNGVAELHNGYPRVVKYQGNPLARDMMERAFTPCDVKWRGFGILPMSGSRIRDEYQHLDARVRFSHDLEELKGREFREPPGCLCGEVLRGLVEPPECPLFETACNPTNPIGPCMVTTEGSCNISMKYGRGAQNRR